MIFEGIYYPVIHFRKVVLYVWCSPFVVSLSSACTLGGTYVLCVCVSPDTTLLIIRPLYHLYKTISPSLRRGCINTLVKIVFLGTEVTLTCDERTARLFLRVMTPSPSTKNLGLTTHAGGCIFYFFKKIR